MYVLGGVAVFAAVALALWRQDVEFASWVAAIVGAGVIGGGWILRGLAAHPAPGGGVGGDDITLTEVVTKGGVTGKRGLAAPPRDPEAPPGSGGVGNDRIRIEGVQAGGDVVGKEERPANPDT